jgi:hypothetical protein
MENAPFGSVGGLGCRKSMKVPAWVEVLARNARMLAFARRCGFAETTRGGLEPGAVRVERSVEQPLAVAAQSAGHRRGVAHRTVSRLLAAILPSPLGSTWDFQQY